MRKSLITLITLIAVFSLTYYAFAGDCTDRDPIGSRCGGGIKFASGLIAIEGGANGNQTKEPECSGRDNGFLKMEWGGYYIDSSADSRTNGAANTEQLAKEGGHPAAEYCAKLVKDGYSDWYLPSMEELYTLSYYHSKVGGFMTDGYWSSTEADDEKAWVQNFGAGNTYTYNKYGTRYVRCIRCYSKRR
ncbi:MAG: DUF1566 domain-containing protein [Candidatus Margulisiibacteriota bacterium]